MPEPKEDVGNSSVSAEAGSLFSDDEFGQDSLVVRVLLDRQLERELDYLAPPDVAQRVTIGSRVLAPLKGRELPGTVVETGVEPEAGAVGKLKPIRRLLDENPVLSHTLLKLARWISEYYCCPMPGVMRSILPTVIRTPEADFRRQLAVELVLMPPPDELEKMARRSPKQHEVLRRILAAEKPPLLRELLNRCKTGPGTVEALVKKGWVRKKETVIERDPHATEQFTPSPGLELNAEQKAALEIIQPALELPEDTESATEPPEACLKPLLLFGVTGSGKTEVYLQAIEQVLEHGRNAIVLVPEISLTPQTVERFKSRFSHIQRQVAVLHSHLSAGERHDEWHKIRDGRARIVIGARSAVFAPLAKVGLIVVDEEHENSYKQDEAPRYNARDVAVVRAGMEGCPIILGSATPSLESFANTHAGKYNLARLTIRADDRQMPLIRVVDLRLESRRGGRSPEPSPLSATLQRAIHRRLADGEQCILFLNRRGFSPSIQCNACGDVVTCPNCSVSVTYHRKDNFLACHLCGFTAVPPKKCPSCGDPGIRFCGFGTEKVEGAVQKLFPEARIARLDADALVRRNVLRETLREFRSRKIDILVGTQMIAKGLHFPNVTLVGILNADMGLHMPDFRAGERTFQLLTQVAGRAGRGDVLGEVFVQTFSPHHAAIQFARQADYDGFFDSEAEMRRNFGFPPYSHMILLTIRGKRQEMAQFTAENLGKRLMQSPPPGMEIHPPAPAPLEKVSGNYRFHISLRAKNIRKLSRYLREKLDALTLPPDIYIAVDVDPYDLL